MGDVKQTIFVNGILHDEEQRVLAVRRSLEDHFLPGYLELPGGRVELGETLEHALKRKLQQELKITAENVQFFMSIAEVNSHGPYVRAIFEVVHNRGEEIAITYNHAEYLWIERADLKNKKFTTDAKKVLEQYLGSVQEQEVAATTQRFTVYTDGGSRGNPGPSASGFVIYDDKNTTIDSGGEYIGITTNNQAEYTAVLLALESAQKHLSSEAILEFHIDSLLVVNQMNGIYKIKNRDLWPLNQQIRDHMKSFKQVRFTHIPREENVVADGKVNEILDAHAGV